MSSGELRSLLDDVPDTFEIVLRRDAWSPVLAAWRDASEEAAAALRSWRTAPCDTTAYVAYRAAQDREDAAQDALAHTQTSLTSVA